MTHVSRRILIGAGLSTAALGAAGHGLWPRLDLYREEAERQRLLPSGEVELEDLVRMAVLAANGHNTQPWKFRLEGRHIAILPDLIRRTVVVDPDNHHLYVSLGCAVENLAIAAAATAQSVAASVEIEGTEAIEVVFSADASMARALYEAIPMRQSTRSEYDGQGVSTQDMALLEAAARKEGVTVLFFDDDADREAILEFVIAGNTAQMNDPAFVRELRDWLRFSPSRAIDAGDGLFSVCSGNPVAPDVIGRRLFGVFFTKKAENKKYAVHIRSSAGIAVFIGDRDDLEHLIKVGRSFERFAHQATALGIRNAHINQPVEDPVLRTQFAAWLGQPGARPDLVIRFGHAPAMPMSLRRPVRDVIL
jgi:hypothetical protein